MKDHGPPQSFRVTYGEVRYAPAPDDPPDAGDASQAGGDAPRASLMSRLNEGLAAARSTILNALVILLMLVGVAYTVVELRREVVVIDPIRLPETLQALGYAEEVAALRLWGAVVRISDAARTAKNRVALLPASERVDFQTPGVGVSVQSLIPALRNFLGLKETRIAGEFICETAACEPARLSLRLRVFRGDRMEIIPLGPIGEPSGAGQAGPQATEALIRDYFKRAALELLRRLDPFIFASYLYQSDPAAAEAVAMKLIGPEDPERKWALNLLGLIAADAGDYQAAIGWYRRALEADEDDTFTIALVNWGNALRNMGQPDAAIARYRQALAQDPDDALAYNNWGAALFDQGDLDGAIEKYRRATELDPEYAYAYGNWGAALFEQGNPELAIPKYRQATLLDPGYAVAYVNWGNALFVQDETDEAAERYARALEIDPGLADATFNLALAYRRLERPGEAAAAFERYLELVPDAPNAEWVDSQIEALRREAAGE